MVPQPNTTNYIVSNFYKVNFQKVKKVVYDN